MDNIKVGADIHAGDGGYSIGTQEKYEEFAKARNRSLRIRELSDIAYKNYLRNNPESSFGRRTDYDKEFAELIILRCCEIADEVERADVPTLASKFIKAHFGVEE